MDISNKKLNILNTILKRPSASTDDKLLVPIVTSPVLMAIVDSLLVRSVAVYGHGRPQRNFSRGIQSNVICEHQKA